MADSGYTKPQLFSRKLTMLIRAWRRLNEGERVDAIQQFVKDKPAQAAQVSLNELITMLDVYLDGDKKEVA